MVNNRVSYKGEKYRMNIIHKTIRRLGITSKYKGYFFLAEAVRLYMEIEERPVLITKDIYPCLSNKYKISIMNIEHDIRTIISICWKKHSDTLMEMVGHSLESKPTNREFVDMIAFYIRENDESNKK